MRHPRTDEQELIIQRAKQTDDNLLLVADAGAAKTSTLEELALELPEVQMLYLVFNKRNAVEAQERLPSNCKPMTLNSLGHRTWSEATGRRIKIEASKTYDILKEIVENETDQSFRRQLYEKFSELMKIIDFGKMCGYIPTDHYERAKRLMDDEQFFTHIEQKLDQGEQDIVRQATLRSLELAMLGTCDYNDQILMPTVFHGAFPRYPLVLVDEAQDLSALNHATLRKMCKKRLIAVGDPNQAIYGFRGAHENSMSKLKLDFNMHEMRLSTSFRCPINIIKHVRWKSPLMNWPAWAKEGEVRTLSFWSADDLPESAAILCRNSAPLFRMAIKLLMVGRPCELGGKDVIKTITKIMSKFGGHELRQASVLDKINQWEADQKEKNRKHAHSGIEDRAECMRIFANQGDDLGSVLAYAQHLAQLHSPLKLLTGHKAKGLEFDHVFFLDEFLINKEDQEPNLRYVICTRAKLTLTYITTEGFTNVETGLEENRVLAGS